MKGPAKLLSAPLHSIQLRARCRRSRNGHCSGAPGTRVGCKKGYACNPCWQQLRLAYLFVHVPRLSAAEPHNPRLRLAQPPGRPAREVCTSAVIPSLHLRFQPLIELSAQPETLSFMGAKEHCGMPGTPRVGCFLTGGRDRLCMDAACGYNSGGLRGGFTAASHVRAGGRLGFVTSALCTCHDS